MAGQYTKSSLRINIVRLEPTANAIDASFTTKH
jgi:hypothetical protein